MWLPPFQPKQQRPPSSRDDGFDPLEPVLVTSPGPHATPWHPARERTDLAPSCYKLCVLGGVGAGKSALVHRVVSRRWEREYRPTRCAAQFFWSPPREVHDSMFELEDTPGVTAANAPRALEMLLQPLLWFEKRRGQRDDQPPAGVAGPDPLANTIASARKRVGFVGESEGSHPPVPVFRSGAPPSTT